MLRNVWVWLHFKLVKGKWSDKPRLFLELLRFREMLLWISQVVGRLIAGYPAMMFPYYVLVDAQGKIAVHGSLRENNGEIMARLNELQEQARSK